MLPRPGIFGMTQPASDQTSQSPSELTELLFANRRKDEFMAILAHELRHPLAPIQAGVELLKRCAYDPITVRVVQSILERQIKHMATLIEDLTDISRIACGRLQLRVERMSIESALQSAIETCRPQLEQSEQQLEVDWVPVGAVVFGDSARLYEVFCNVLNNAIKYTPPRGHIRIATRCEANSVVVTATDNGVGMAAEDLPHIFEMFAQARAGHGRSSGLGIGLALAKRLVLLHGGQIEATSAGLGCGSTFTITLPAAAATDSSSPHPISGVCSMPTQTRASAPDAGPCVK